MTTPEDYLPEELRVYSTRGGDLTTGRTFVHAGRWYERVEDGVDEAVSFPPVADSEEELRTLLLDQGEELTEVGAEEERLIREEFSERTPLEPFEEERSDQPPFEEQEP